MSVPFQRISNATVDDIITYDPAAERRASSICLEWDKFFDIGDQEILYKLEWAWWPKYCDTVFGAYYFKNDSQNRLVTAFDPELLVKSDQTLIRLSVFKAVEEFYRSLVTDVANINEVDKTNYEFAQKRFNDEWEKAFQLSNFYDLRNDGFISKLEENYKADVDYFMGDKRYF